MLASPIAEAAHCLIELHPPCPPGLRIEVHPSSDRYISPSILSSGVWEPYETELLLSHIRTGDTVLDIGANIGYYTLAAAARTGPSGRVWAFEPEPVNFAILRRNIRRNRLAHVTAYPWAVAARTGALPLYLSPDNFGDHRVFHPAPGEDPRARIDSRPSVSLDTFALFHNLKPALVKIDAQGAEGSILEGAALMIARHRPIFFVEFWPFGLQAAGSEPEQMLFPLRRYRLFRIAEEARLLRPVTTSELLCILNEPGFPADGHINLIAEP